jgi:hypothetical protein
LDFPLRPRLTCSHLTGNNRKEAGKPAPNGIDPNAKQALHRDCRQIWQGIFPAVAPGPQQLDGDPPMFAATVMDR